MLRFLVYLVLIAAISSLISLGVGVINAKALIITIHVLEYQDHPTSLGDMTEDQCELLKEEIETENGTMEDLQCVPREVRRELT